jgi:hypothetical protein
LGTSAQGFPITCSVDGKQYIAVLAGRRRAKAGQALYVYALDDQK